MKIKIGLLAFLVFGFVPFGVRAAVVFSEIQYDPQGTDTKHEWVEIYNSGETSIDISAYKFNDGSSTTNHVFNVPPANGGQGAMLLAPHAYAIIADDASTFLADTSGYTGTVIDSSFALVNTQSALRLFACPDACTSVDVVTYSSEQGAVNDGKTLQRTESGIWKASSPTPGRTYAESSVSGDSVASSVVDTVPVVVQGTGTTSTTEVGTPSSSVPIKKASTSASVSAPSSVLSGVAFPLKVSATMSAGVSVSGGIFHVAFGDGTDATLSTDAVVEHTYAYPGTYVVTVQYRSNIYTAETAPPDATARVVLEALEPQVAISHAADGAVMLKNNGSKEVDLSRWIVHVEGDSRDIQIPEGTIILAKKVITIPPTKIPVSTRDLTLLLPSGVTASTSAATAGVTVKTE